MRALAFDLGTHFGWAASHRPNLVFASDHKDLGKPKVKKHEAGDRRLFIFGEYVHRLIDINKPDVIFYELVMSHSSTYAAQLWGSWLGILTVEAMNGGVTMENIKGFGVTEIKKHATGRGNAPKPAMISAASRISGRDIEDDNEADAICVLDYGLNHFNK